MAKRHRRQTTTPGSSSAPLNRDPHHFRKYWPAALAVAILMLFALGSAIALVVHGGKSFLYPFTSPNTSGSPTVSQRPVVSVSPHPSSSLSAPTPSLPPWPADPVSSSFSGSVPPVPELTGIRAGSHAGDGYDRIAFDFSQASPPGYQVQYVDLVSRDGSGQPVQLAGNNYLQITFSPAAAHNAAGQSSLSPVPTSPVNTSLRALKSYVLNGDFEGRVSVALGIDGRNGFHVYSFQRAPGLWTVYVDVRLP